ncbi:phospholipase D-like domain-containing protein [Rhizobium leguminosarum]|uniref:phospholipase D-like domain-containing protein n=1 Tax=Rhizobium leguminosarum TaxID=384 RepID=UPI001C945F49|nr:phospholipase D-like domain-containing protein [Rhizobium leguminosarum]MBY5404682.1 hypothetical protein [Rhizobium leguminosarum]
MTIDPHHPLSLIEHAAPPEGMRGHAGWVCGFSADADFMDAFVERFTGLGKRARADLGRTFMCLCLDSSQPQVPPGEVPGVLHLPALNEAPPYRLMHAKVALLAFRDMADDSNWALRLLVATGNWTRQTTQDSIDLVWRLDFTAKELEAGDRSHAFLAGLADMAAARDFWGWLRHHYQCGIFEDKATGGTAATTQRGAFEAMHRWLDAIVPDNDVPPRFVHTAQQALIKQLKERIGIQAGSQRRNTLVLGSGFWEGVPGDGLPVVPSAIIDTLTDGGLLTRGAEINLVVEKDDCGALADERVFARMQQKNWKLRPALKYPAKGSDDTRRLHAKFLFSANYQDSSDRCAGAWVYLGSGNLTRAGFLDAPRRDRNLEAGIIAAAPGLLWYESKSPGVTHLGKVLPISWDHEITDVSQLEPGDGPPDRETRFVAAPVSHLQWIDSEATGLLTVPEGEDGSGIVVIGPGGEPIAADGMGRFPWPCEQPAQVGVRFEDRHGRDPIVQVPVLDMYGRLAASPLEAIDFERAIELLERFPTAPENDNEDEASLSSSDHQAAGLPSGAGSDTRYTIRRTMQLIESIAERQTMVPEADWSSWTQRLQCVLSQLGNLPGNSRRCEMARHTRAGLIVEALAELKTNPLTCLRLAPFLPDYVVPGSQALEDLDAALGAVEANWGVKDFRGFEYRSSHAG